MVFGKNGKVVCADQVTLSIERNSLGSPAQSLELVRKSYGPFVLYGAPLRSKPDILHSFYRNRI